MVLYVGTLGVIPLFTPVHSPDSGVTGEKGSTLSK